MCSLAFPLIKPRTCFALMQSTHGKQGGRRRIAISPQHRVSPTKSPRRVRDHESRGRTSPVEKTGARNLVALVLSPSRTFGGSQRAKAPESVRVLVVAPRSQRLLKSSVWADVRKCRIGQLAGRFYRLVRVGKAPSRPNRLPTYYPRLDPPFVQIFAITIPSRRNTDSARCRPRRAPCGCHVPHG